MLFVVLASLSAGFVTAPSAHAQTAHDGFAYTNGANLVGQSGGSGWLGNWLAIGSPTPATSPLITSTGLDFPGYTSTGGALRDTGGAFAATRQWFTPATGFANGTTIWFSCLVRATNTSTSDTLVLPFGDKGSTTSGHGIAFATKATANGSTSSSDTYVYLRHGSSLHGTDGTTSGPGLLAALGTSKTILVVGRFTLSTSSNSDVLDVWVNQTTAPTGDAPLRRTGFTASRSSTASDGRALLYFGSAAQSTVDEFRIGTSYAAVTTGLTPATPPAITLDTPSQDQLFASPATISLTATVTPGAATIKKVLFYNGATLLGEDTTAPYSFNFTNVPASQPKLSARVVYDLTAGQNADYVQQSATRSVYVLDNSPVTFAVNTQASRRAISPYIYGTNNISNSAQLRELNFTLNRRGGEVESRYDYQTNSNNIAKNWYFTTDSASGTPASEVGGYIKATFDAQAEVMVTVPTIGWMPKPGTHSFSQTKYGLQTSNVPFGSGDAGIGILQLDASGNIIPYNPATAVADRAANAGNPTVELTPNHPDPRFRSDRNDANYLPANPLAYQSGFIDTLISQWGTVANGGVRFYTLDNEPGLWDYVHRDLWGGSNVTKEEIRDYTIAYGNMIRDRDPAAQILGPSEWGWAEADDYYPWLLAQLQASETATGRRSLDILTVHYYAGYPGAEGTLDRLFGLNRSTRSLWDPNHTDESWINSKINLIPTMRSWVAANYPGTKIGITEYNWSFNDFDNSMAGAVIQAEVLGIFGREGLDLATRWGSSANNPSNLIFKGMKMFRNYDGRRSSFGDTSVAATTSANPDEINAFAAERSTDGALTLMAVNKQPSGDRSTTFSLANFAHRGTAQAWRLDSSGVIARLPDLTVTGNALATTLPPQTITIYVLPTAANLIAPQVTAPVPANGALNVPTSLTAAWTPSANTSLYHVYLGTSQSAVAAATPATSGIYRGASATPDFDLTSLTGNTTYYWRVDAEATGGTTTGAVWSFTTALPPRGVVTLNSGDGFGSSSYNAAGNWSNSAAPSLANDYFTSNKELRSPAGASGTTPFGGYSLSLDSNGTLTTKGANNNTLAIERLFLNGGRIRVGDQNNLVTISGSLAQVTAASTLDADQASRTLVIASPLTGSGRLTIASGTGTGGVVRLSGVNDAFTGPWIINSGATLQVGNGGATGSLGSGDLTHNGALTFNRTGLLTVPGDISGSGTLTLNSALALTLDGASTYTGATTVSTGSLFVTGSLGNTTVSVASAATLGGDGAFAGPVTVQGTFAPGATGQNSTGHLTFGGSLTLATTTTTRLELNRTAAVTHDAVAVTGAFTAAGSLVITNLGDALVAGDSFALFNKAPTSGAFANVTLPALPAGLTWQNNLAVNGTVSVLGANPPGEPADPAPADDATGLSPRPDLSWTPGDAAVTHRVYLGTNEAAVAAATPATAGIYQGEQTATTFTPPADLLPATTYYWRIDQVGPGGVTAGPVWSFTTAAYYVSTREPFNYTLAANLTAQNGGTGWRGPWLAATHSSVIDPLIVGAGLTHPNLVTTGNAVRDTSGTRFTNARKWFEPATPIPNGTTVWFSALVSYNINHNSDLLILPFGNSTESQNTNGLGIAINSRLTASGATDANARVYLRNAYTNYGIGGSTTGAGLSAAPIGTPFLVVGRFTLSTTANADTLDVWVNPSAAPAANSTLRLTGFTAPRTPATSAGNFVLYSGYSAQSAIDELALGTSYADVTRNITGSVQLTATVNGPSQIDLSWTDQTFNTTGFRLERAPTPTGTYTLLAEVGPGDGTYTDTGLPAASTYCYRLTADHASGGVISSNIAIESTPLANHVPVIPTFEFQKRKHGLFVHYVFGGFMGDYTALGYQQGYPTTIDQLVNAFNVNTFADQVASMGVEYLIFTAYHANMNVLYPSTKMAAWRGPGHATTSRDLLGEICDAMALKGIKVHFYMHIDIGQDFSPADRVATGYDLADRTTWNSFMNEIVGEIGTRYGSRLEGFWLDGAYINSTALNGLKTAMRSVNPDLIIVGNNAQSFGEYDLGCKEAGSIDQGTYSMTPDAPAGFPVTQAKVSSWLAYDRQIALIAGGGWWSSNNEINSGRYSVDDLVKYTALQAGANTHGGGVAWAAGCFGNGSFDPDFLAKMQAAWGHLEPVSEAIHDTVPSTSFPTPVLASIERLSGGFTATMSPDGHFDYIHVLRPPTGRSLRLPPPLDLREFVSAHLLPGNQPVTLAAQGDGYQVTLPEGANWDPRNTVIRLTAQLPLPVTSALSVAADVRMLNIGGAGQAGADTQLGVYQGRDRTLLRFDLSSVPAGSTLHSANLTLYATSSYHDNTMGNPVQVFRATKPWTEFGALWARYDATTNWTNPGGDAVGITGLQLSAPYAVNTSDPAANGPLTWDITTLAQEWLAGTYPNQGMLITLGGNQSNLHFHSRESTSTGLRPSLLLTFTPPPAPEPATTPVPADAATNVAINPSLGWTPGLRATAHRVFLGTDSAAVAAATPSTTGIYRGEQATTTFTPSAALTNSTTYYWRIDEVGTGGVTPGTVWSFTTIAPVLPYVQWATEQGLTPGPDTAITADPEADGRSNLLEYVLGGSALTADPAFNPTITNSAANLVYTFSRTDRSEADTTLVVQYGSSLLTVGTWTNVPVGATSSTTGDVTVTVAENATAPDTVTVTIPRGAASTLFVRLRATRP